MTTPAKLGRMSAHKSWIFALALLSLMPFGVVECKVNLFELLQDLNLTTLAQGYQSTGMHHLIDHEGNFTIFAPTNDAFVREKKYPGEDSVRSKLLFHIGKGLHFSDDLRDEMVIKSFLAKRSIRINVYPNGKITANGRQVLKTDFTARNGIVHTLNDVMSSIYKIEGSVVSELQECCPQHSDIVQLVKMAGLYRTLDTRGPFTLLAPNNGAFDKLGEKALDALKANRTLLARTLLNHVIRRTWYTAGIEDGQVLETIAGDRLTVRIINGVIYFGSAEVTMTDVTAGNGAVHAVDAVLLPSLVKSELAKMNLDESSNDLVSSCRRLGFTSFAQALEETKVAEVVSSKKHFFTLFVPSNEAFENPDLYPINFDLETRVRFHVARGVAKRSRMDYGYSMPTILKGRFIRFDQYNTDLVTANGREIDFEHSISAVNGVVYGLRRGMDYIYNANSTLLHELRRIPKFSKFVKFVSSHSLSEILDDPKYSYTVLVPDNRVFQRYLDRLPDAKVYSKLMVNHVIPGTWYEQGLVARGEGYTISGRRLIITKDEQGKVHIDNKRLVRADFSAANGVFHEVDGLF